MRIGFIGAGKVGFSLGRFFAEGGITVTGYYSRHRESAQEAAEFTGTKQYDELLEFIEDCDALFLTVPDGAISLVYEQLKRYEIAGKQICHCSGAMTAGEAFPDIRDYGAYGYSIHPLFPISSKYDTYRELADAFFCLEGGAAQEEGESPAYRRMRLSYLQEWERLLQTLGCKVRRILPEAKISYHAACAISSNLVCALVQESIELLEGCGFSGEEARQALAPLMRSNLEHVIASGPLKALTGPMERCDVGTVEKHLHCFSTEEEQQMYRAVSQKLLQMAQSRHPDTDYTKMAQILCDSSAINK